MHNREQFLAKLYSQLSGAKGDTLSVAYTRDGIRMIVGSTGRMGATGATGATGMRGATGSFKRVKPYNTFRLTALFTNLLAP